MNGESEPVNRKPIFVFHKGTQNTKQWMCQRILPESSYQVTGGFFMWIEHVYDKEFVKKLNQHARSRTWSNDVFEKYTGKDAETLWKEHNEFLQTLEGNRILPSRDFGRVGFQHCLVQFLLDMKLANLMPDTGKYSANRLCV